jgi:oxygen-dependent protoporphyrinogen oxidase
MRVAVIGGGMAGLSAALEARRLGHEAVVFERGRRAGGKVGSVREGGWLTEDGPHFIARPMDALLEVAGLQKIEPQPPKTRWVRLGGKSLRAPSLGLLLRLGVPRALLEPIFARKSEPDRPLRTFLVDRLGSSAGAVVSSLLASGVYAGDAEKLSSRSAFPSLPAGSLLFRKRGPRAALWSLREGLGSLPSALAARLGDAVRLGAAVERLEQTASGWRVQGEEFDRALLALPASAAARLVPALAGALSGFRAAAVTLVHLGFSAGQLPRGFGLLDASDELRFLGALLPSSMLPGRTPEGCALVTAICGGARHPEIARLPDSDLLEAVRADLRRGFGTSEEPRYRRIVRVEEAIPQYEVGHAGRVVALRQALAALPGLELAGASYDGVSVPETALSGAAAARRLLGSSEAAAR